jgi:hypothetical protein
MDPLETPSANAGPLERAKAPHSSWRASDLPLLFTMVGLIALVIALRDPLPLFRSEFWAEDATEFFFGAQEMGLRSLVTPVYGYFFLLSRLIAYLATFFGVLYTPFIYAWACLGLNAITAAYAVRDGFSWLLPERWQRAVLALLVAIGPGTCDVFLNLAGLPISLALLALLLLIEKPWRPGWARLLLLLVLLLSSGQAVLWLPVVAYLWWETRSTRYVVVAGALAAVAAMNLIGSHAASAAAGLSDYGNVRLVPRILLENLFTRIVPGPILGSGLTGRIMAAPSAVFWSAAIVGLGAVTAIWLRFYRVQREAVVLLGLAYLGAIASLGVIAVSRNYAIPQLVREAATLHWELRYSFLPGAIALMAWSLLLARGSRVRPSLRAASAAGLACLALNVVTLWPAVHPRPDLHWPRRAARVQAILDQTGLPRSISILDLAIHPVEWLPNNDRWQVELPGR